LPNTQNWSDELHRPREPNKGAAISSLAGLPRSAICDRSQRRDTVASAENASFRTQELALQSRFYRAIESASGRLEKPSKNPIYSIACRERLCARRNAPFMAEIRDSAPDFAPLIRDILEGLT
jgi:hypothetical protein